jgi:hypothetical protein
VGILTEERKRAILDFARRKLDVDEFCRVYGIHPDAANAEVVRLLRQALTEGDGGTVELGLLLAAGFSVPLEIDLVHRLVVEEWHNCHEDLIAMLQRSRSPASIPYLRRAIELKPRLDYLAYDDYGAYYKKCLWALQAIASAEARELIGEFTESQDEVLRAEARYRISRGSKPCL